MSRDRLGIGRYFSLSRDRLGIGRYFSLSRDRLEPDDISH